MKPDIELDNDIVLLVDSFYNKVLEDKEIGFIFKEHMKLSLLDHLPIMYSFWQSVLLDRANYRGNVMIKHIELNRLVSLTEKHFDKWIELWSETVDAMFAGEKAEAAKQKAKTMGELMKYKIQKSGDDNFIL